MAELSAVFVSIDIYSSTLDKLIQKTDQAVDKLLKVCKVTKGAVSDMLDASAAAGKAADKMLKAGTTSDKAAEKMDKVTSSTDKMIDKMLKAGTSTEKVTDKMLEASSNSGEAADKLLSAADSVDKMNEKLGESDDKAEKASGGFGKLIGSLVNLDNIQKGMKLVDDFTGVNTRLGLVNDGLQSQAELQDKVFAAASRSRGAYSEMADTVSKLDRGNVFGSNDETIAFTELMQKSFVADGSSPEDQSSSMQQLTDSMTSGGLKGDDLSSLEKSAPMILEAISSYTGKSGDELMALADKGKITSDIIKNSMFSMSDEINTNFENTPMTFTGIWTQIKNAGLQAFSGIMEKITEFISSDDFSGFLNGLLVGFSEIGKAADRVMNVISSIALFFSDNWAWISPLVWGIVGAFIAYNAAALITNGILMAQAVMEGIKAIATSAEAGSTFLATVAQQGLNAALFACPITWIVLAVIALIAIFYAVIGAINQFAGTSLSATGIILGAFTTVGAVIGNIFLGLLELLLGFINALINPFINIANFIGNVFTNPISSIIYLFQGMADGILGTLEKVASAIDLVTGTNMADAVAGWRVSIKNFADETIEKYAPEENYKTVVDGLDLSIDKLGLDRISYEDAWNFGYNGGKSVDKNVSNITNIFSTDTDKNNIDPSKYMDEDALKDLMKDSNPNPNIFPADNKIDPSNPIPVEGTGANGAVNVEMPDDDLDYLREIAERDYIANIATNSLSPNISIQFGDVHENADANKIAGRIKKILQEEIAMTSEG
ncbi:MAG: tape measure protein [Anaerocolumna sp.]